LSNEEKTHDYENFEKGMIYMNIFKKGEYQSTYILFNFSATSTTAGIPEYRNSI
jgi:hypothetical protein